MEDGILKGGFGFVVGIEGWEFLEHVFGRGFDTVSSLGWQVERAISASLSEKGMVVKGGQNGGRCRNKRPAQRERGRMCGRFYSVGGLRLWLTKKLEKTLMERIKGWYDEANSPEWCQQHHRPIFCIVVHENNI